MHRTTRRLPRSDDPSMRLGWLGALFASSVVFLHVPVSLWAGNVPEFDSAPAALLVLGAAAVLGAVLTGLAALYLLPPPARAALASLMCAGGIVAWACAYLLVGEMAVLTGQNAPMDFETPLGAWEMPLAIATWLVMAAVIARARAASIALFAVLNVALFGATAIAVLSADDVRPTSGSNDALFRFSSRENVLIALLDGLQSDVASAVFQSDPELAAAFDGFKFYKDTVSPAPSTFLSLPAIHSGEVYEPPGDLPVYFTRAIEERSFVNRFAEAGYDTALVNPMEGVCPAAVAACASVSSLLQSPLRQLKHEALQLLDLSLFRVSPVWLKRWIYDDGQWLVAAAADLPDEIVKVVEGVDLFAAVAERLTTDGGPPTLKFLHSLSTHTPYVLDGECAVASMSLDLVAPQSRCALRAVAMLLDRLKRAHVYDSTLILLLADHGMSPGVFRNTARHESTTLWRRQAGAANPVFLIKPRDSRGALRDVPGAVHLADVPATLCAETGACVTSLGTPAGQAAPDRPRRFNDYVWRHEFWKTRTIPSVTPYDVRGHVWSMGSWRRPGAPAEYRLGDEIRFGASDGGRRYLQLGWSRGDAWGSWTLDRVANIVLDFTEPVDGPLDLIADVKAFVPPAVGRQEVTWVANGLVLGTWSFVDHDRASERLMVVPRAATAGRRELVLQLRVSVPGSPLESGTGRDPRRLGLALGEMKLVPHAGE